MMADKPKLTLGSALDVFRKELYTVMIDAGWEEHYFEVGGLHAGDSHFVTKFRKIACVSHRTYREANTDNLIAAALRWLAGKPPGQWSLEEDELSGFDQEMWPRDPVRWLLEEVRAQMKREKEDGDVGHAETDA